MDEGRFGLTAVLQGSVPLRTVLLLSIFAAVDIAASAGFVLLRVIMVSASRIHENNATWFKAV